DGGAGEKCRVTISKRDDTDADRSPLTPAETARAKMEGRAALRQLKEARARDEDEHEDERINTLHDILTKRVTVEELYGVAKSAEGDEAEGLITEPKHHASHAADLLVESGSHGTREEALLLHNPRGAALLRRLHKYQDTPMPINLSDVVKNHGIVALC